MVIGGGDDMVIRIGDRGRGGDMGIRDGDRGRGT